VTLWGENLTDETVITAAGPQTVFGTADGGMQFFLNEPRTYGVTMDVASERTRREPPMRYTPNLLQKKPFVFPEARAGSATRSISATSTQEHLPDRPGRHRAGHLRARQPGVGLGAAR